MPKPAKIIGQANEKMRETIRKENVRLKTALAEFGSLKSFMSHLRHSNTTKEQWYKENCINKDFLSNALEDTLSMPFPLYNA